MTTTYMTRDDKDVGVGSFDSIAWLYETVFHVPDGKVFNYAMVYGNLDSPSKVELWSDEPNYDSKPDHVWEVSCG